MAKKQPKEDNRPRLSIQEMADYELLTAVNEVPKSMTEEIADSLDRNIRSVSSRLNWMRRMGLVSKTLALGWILTNQGKDVLNGWSEDIMEVRDITARARRSKAMNWVMRREVSRDLN